MKKILISTVLLIVSNAASSATIYVDETDYLNALASSGYSTIYESFEDDNAWVRSPTLTSSTTSQGLVWESNSFNSTTGTLGGSVIDCSSDTGCSLAVWLGARSAWLDTTKSSVTAFSEIITYQYKSWQIFLPAGRHC
jgi:hypothetical protein